METKPALYDALAKARLEFATVVKDKTAKIASQKGSYSYTYADLASVIEATAAALAKHGLSIIQEPEVSRENGDIWLTLHGSLCHAGGEVVPFRPLTMPVGTNADARTIGTAISYARRYQLISVLNIAAEADDDDAASTTPPTRQQRTPEPQPELPANGKHAPEPQPEAPPLTSYEADMLAAWEGDVIAAKNWAVKEGSCENEFEASNSLRKIVDEKFGGRLHTGNRESVLLAFLRRQQEKLAEMAQAEPEPAP